MQPRRRRVVRCRLAVFAGAAAWLLASGQAGASLATVLHQAAERALAQHSARVTFSASLVAPGGGRQRQLIALKGAETFATPQVGQFTGTIAAGAKATVGFGEILDGTAMYLQLHGTWFSTTRAAVEENMGVEGSSGGMVGSDPTQLLAVLGAQGAKIRRLGPVTLGGVPMTEYRATVVLSAGTTNPAGIALTPAYIQSFDKLTGGAPLTVEVWVDRAGAARQEEIDTPLSAAGLTLMGLGPTMKGATLRDMVGLSNFGVSVDVTAPTDARPLPFTSSGATPA
jgi:hypothetical protein